MVLVKSLFYNHVVNKKIWLRHEAESFTKKFIKLLLMMREILQLYWNAECFTESSC